MAAVSVQLRRPSETFRARAWAALDADERDRARRFREPRDAHRFATTRLALREALTERCPHVPPSAWRYRRTPSGRLLLDGPHTTLEFSLSRTDDLVAVVVTDGVPCGVDVETIGRVPDVEELGATVLADTERAELQKLCEPDERVEAFFRSWTVKEAYGKAIGKGLGYALDRVAVTRDEDDVVLAGELEGSPERWSAFVRQVTKRERLALVLRDYAREPVSWQLRWTSEDDR